MDMTRRFDGRVKRVRCVRRNKSGTRSIKKAKTCMTATLIDADERKRRNKRGKNIGSIEVKGRLVKKHGPCRRLPGKVVASPVRIKTKAWCKRIKKDRGQGEQLQVERMAYRE